MILAEEGITFSGAGITVIGILLAALATTIGVLWKQTLVAQAAQNSSKDAQFNAVVAAKDGQINAQAVQIAEIQKQNAELSAARDKAHGIAMNLALGLIQSTKNTDTAMTLPPTERPLQPTSTEDAHAG